MLPQKRFGSLSSPENPQQLADEINGLIVGFSTLIIFTLHHFGINIGTVEVANFAVGAGTAASSLWIVYGLVKRFIVWFHDKVKQPAN